MKNKKALSTVIATVLIILLTVAAIAIVWTFVKKMVDESKNKVESCFGIESSEKVTLNGLYTCYINNSADPGLEEVQFSINIADVEIEALIVSIMAGGSSKSFTITNEGVTDANLKYYGTSTFGEDAIKLPGKNSGRTYVARYDTTSNKVDWIGIAPVANGEQCGITDQINDISNCALLAV
jgi:FlaG/FlaF family flagellin (archaellin)